MRATPSELSFAPQQVNTLSAPQSVQIMRTRWTQVKATVTGANANDFIVVRNDCQGDADYLREACGAVVVRFRPSAPGPRLAVLVLEGEVLSPGYQSVPLAGTGVGPAPKRVSASITALWQATRSFTQVRRLLVRKLPTGARVQVRCRGKGCPFSRRTARVRSGRADARKGLATAKLRPGATVEIRVTRPGFVGQVVRYRMRKGRIPSRRRLCLSPGKTTPRTC